MKISKYKKNSLGTLSIDLRAPHMRKYEEFCFYPVTKEGEPNTLCIQSKNYWAEISVDKKQIEFSARHSNGAYKANFVMDRMFKKTRVYPLEDSLISELTEKVRETSSPMAGSNRAGMFTDNSGAKNVGKL